MGNKRAAGHLAALFTIIIWGTTFISTKVLLVDFKPVEILFFRFVIGFAALLIVCPRRMKGAEHRQEMTFALAGLSGICLYYLLENIALTYTMASNVGVIISVAPFFTAILSRFFLKSEGKLRVHFFIGFAVAMAAAAGVHDFTAFGGEMYREMGLGRFADMTNLLNILYLGLGASALCFVTWNLAVKALGAVKTSVYIYMVPVITVVTSALVLQEPVTWTSAVGTVLAVTGLFLSEYGRKGNEKIFGKITEKNKLWRIKKWTCRMKNVSW